MTHARDRQYRPPAFVALSQSTWRELAQAVKEHLTQRWHAEAGRWDPTRVRLVVSLRLLSPADAATTTQHLKPLVTWLAAQCGRIQVTTSFMPEHRLYVD